MPDGHVREPASPASWLVEPLSRMMDRDVVLQNLPRVHRSNVARRVSRTLPASQTKDTRLIIGRGIQGTYLSSWMLRSGISQAAFHRALGASPSQCANWLSGREILPSHYWRTVSEALGLHPEETVELMDACEASARVGDLERLFGVEVRPKKKKAIQPKRCLLSYFVKPSNALQHFLHFIGELVARDVEVMSHLSPACIANGHLEAAVRVCHDIQSYISEKTPNVFTERNIASHLRHPHHAYIGYFIFELDLQHGPGVTELQDSIFASLEGCIHFSKSSHVADVRIAQHALHLLARYRTSPVSSFKDSANPETRRMAYFGEVFRSFDNGPFEELAELILTDEPFGQATFDFDRLHYRDVGPGGALALPINTMTRHMAALADSRPSMRLVASARVCNGLRRINGASLSSPVLLERIANAQSAIEDFDPHGPVEIEAQNQLIKIARQAFNGG